MAEQVAQQGAGLAALGVRPPQRADARRNFDALIAAARAVFAEQGTDASLEDIARRAGVGIGTLYRNFPTRQDLFERVYIGEVEDLCALARPHLYDPHWTLHAAAEQGYTGPGAPWPLPYGAGSRTPPTGRTDGPKPRLTLG